jgi:hypothetical protein
VSKKKSQTQPGMSARDEGESRAAFRSHAQRLDEWRLRSSAATAKAADALARLLQLAEERRSGQIERVALFLGSVLNGKRHFDLYDLRTVDVAISDDMLAVIDGLRWGRVGISNMVVDADVRIDNILRSWGMYGDGQTGQFICVRM